jgi:hypothetical protein
MLAHRLSGARHPRLAPRGRSETVREADGKVHELQASTETLQNLKVGDRIEAKLREAPKC